MEKLTDLLRTRRAESADQTAYQVRIDGQWKPITWAEADERVDRIAAGLAALGIQPGDVVSILGRTCLEWALCDLAVLRAGGVSVGIYPTLIGEQCAYILEDSSARWLFLEDARQVEKLSPFFEKLPRLDRPILWDSPEGEHDFMCLKDLEDRGRTALEADPGLTLRTEEKIQPEDVDAGHHGGDGSS